MGFFGPSAIEEAVYRQLETLRSKLWGNADDRAAELDAKESRIDGLAAELLKTDNAAIRKAQKNWIADARNSITHRRYLLERETHISVLRLPALPLSY